ncbi:MAG: histidinol dehydrogenase [Candidatus Bathyarchaeia archaeon]
MNVLTTISVYRFGEASRDDLNRVMRRAELEFKPVFEKAKTVLEEVKRSGDRALKEYSSRFDGVRLEDLKATHEEFEEAEKTLGVEVKKAVKHAAENIRRFHKAQLPPESWFIEVERGVTVGQRITPIDTVGLYVPGGRGSFPSTVLMATIPAKIAGVKRVIICTPPRRDGSVDPATLYAAKTSGVEEVYKVGGAHGIAAMAFGTETIPRVDKIVGPGGVWVASAKRLVQLSGVGIEFTAGPSEIMILADDSAKPEYVAADVLIEAEHGSDSAGVVVTNSPKLAEKAQTLVEDYIRNLPDEPIPRRSFAKEALSKYGAIILTNSLDEAIDFVNEYSPEHLEIMTKDPMRTLKKVRNAGSIYLGDYSPSSVGCYASGVNHIIPTGGDSRVHSPLSVTDFLKRSDITYLSREGLSALKETVLRLSTYEGFPQHARAVELRFQNQTKFKD